jgi:hypothetical protein
MESKDIFNLYEAYTEIYSPQEVDEATAMAKRGYDETKLRQRAGGGEAADRASALEKKPTYGDASKAKQRSEYARKQRGDFRKTASSSPGLHGYGHKSDDPKVKAKQAARGAQRGALTPNERKQLNMEIEYDVFDLVLEFLQAEGYVETLEEAEWMMANLIDEEAVDIILEAMDEDEEKLDEADSIAAMRERAAKRRQQRYGKQGGGGRDDFRPYTQADYERGAANDPRKKVKEDFESWLDEAMSNYEKNRKRAAQRAAARNEARAQGKTGVVPGVGYVTPRKERETWTDESGKTRHAKGL